jgi:hypothetical protein
LISGALLARAGEYGAAITFLEPLVDAGSPAETHADDFWFNGLHALAWAYRHAGADEKAARLLASAARLCDDERAAARLRDGLELHRCAETELLRGGGPRARRVRTGGRRRLARLLPSERPAGGGADRPAYRVLIEKVSGRATVSGRRSGESTHQETSAKVDAARAAAQCCRNA